MSTIKDKILGLVCIGIGALLLCLEYIVVCAIGSLGGWIADMVGATGSAHTGITLLAYVPVIGLVLLILVGAVSAFAIGLKYFMEK